MVTSVYNSQLGGQSTSETTDHIRKRKVIANTGNRARNVNKLVKFKNATLNWLNGLPPTDYDSALHEFNADNFHETENQNEDSDTNMNSTEKAGFKRNLKRFKKLFKSSEKRRELAEAAATAEALQDENLNGSFPDSPFEKVGKVQNLEETQYMEIRPNVREIFLPPDVAGQRKFLRNLTPKMRKKFAESHPWTVSNEIHTAKYTFLNFVPKNLFEQFRRVANVYFLILIILQGIPIFSNTNIFLAASPLFSILLVTAVKDAVEDWKRQKSDNLVNNSLVKVLERADEEAVQDQNSNEKTGSMMQKLKNLFKFSTKNGADAVNEQPDGWKQTFWKDIRVGDIVMILNNDSIPADVIVLSTSDSHGICYVETKNLDGETNLKIRQAPKQTAHMVTAEEVSKLNAVLQVEQPSTKLYTFNGKMILPTGTEVEGARSSQEDLMDAEAFPITPDNLLLRGCQIRNTEFVIGVVAYTGPHSKIIMNSGKTPSKRSRIEKQMNPQIILSFALLIVICLTCAIMQGLYIGGSTSQAPYWYTVYKTGAMASPLFTGFLTFWSSLILFQTLVPISLYITVEICKLIQAAWIHWDLSMYFPERDQRAVPRSWNIADDLGQIEYIFSDKTGTLTRNVMEFRKCSIGKRSYGYLPEDSSNSMEGQLPAISQEQFDSMEAKMSDCLNQVLPYKYVPPSQMSFVDPSLFTDLLNVKDSGREQSEKIKNFFFALIVCHTILIDKLGMTEEVLNESLTENPSDEMVPHLLQYQAQSPDEAALVKAARDLGFVFLGRDQEFLNLSVLGQLERVQVLSVIEFNSTRKRMSVIIKKMDGSIWLISKGADSVIYERLKKCQVSDESEKSNLFESNEQSMRDETMRHLEDFAESGLRTLCFASRRLSLTEYENFSMRHAEASTSMANREMLMDAVAEEYERELQLLGCTAIEDRLQDGVPDTISNLQMAGIKIWVLTGDKMETAVNIGFSCKLLTRKMYLIMIKSDDATVEGTRKQLDDGFRKMSFTSSMDVGGEIDPSEVEMESWYSSSEMNDAKPEYALIIDGTSLKHALEDRQCRPIFLDLATNCKAVLCCRVSPLQKAKCVELIKKTRNVMTLAIGDGANDVSMIQEADVGIGIAGEEGMQAVMSSDYAIAQFSYLERLLLVHGRLSYVRTAKITLLSFCKNVSFVLVAFWFQIYCAFTAQYTYDYMYLLYFNMFFTMLPVLLLGVFDQQISNEKLQKVPQLYADGMQQKYYSMKLFLQYSAVAIYQSLCCYFIPQLVFTDVSVSLYGFPESKTMIGNVQAFSIIMTINLFTASHMENWNLFFIAGLFLTGLVFLGFVLVYLLFPLSDMYGSWGDFMTVPFWAAIILTVSIAILPTFLFPFVRGWIWPKRPSDIEIVREIGAYSEKIETPTGSADEIDLEAGQDANNPPTLHDQLMETVRDAQLRANSACPPTNSLAKWTPRGHEDVTIPPRAIPVIRSDGHVRLRTLTASSNEFSTEDQQREPQQQQLPLSMENVALHSQDALDYHIREYTDTLENNPNTNRGILSRSKTLRRLKEKFKLFNLRTGRMEKLSGFAFAQESGAARTIPSASIVKKPEDAAK